MKRKQYISGTLTALLGSGILAFGLYHIHAQADVTEGGQLGLSLLLQHHLSISPALSGFVLNVLCYLIGWKTFGKSFLFYSGVSAIGFSLFYGLFQQFPPIFPEIREYPLIAALSGAVFVGFGCGLCIRAGGAPTADDALAMSISKLCKLKIEYIYMISDLSVLLLSLTYIPVQKIVYSLLTVLLSGKLIGLVQRIKGEKYES